MTTATDPVGAIRDYKEITFCRACKSTNLTELFTLGDQWLTDFPDPGHESEGIVCPLTLILCNYCSFVQLKHTVNQDSIYGREIYWYKSGINDTMRLALKDVVDKGSTLVDLQDGDTIIDIGSNDGTLASFYPDAVRKIGFEPSYNVWSQSHSVGWFKSYNNYFTYKGETAKIITSCAMFYDLDDPSQFLKDINASLEFDGIWIDQQNYLTLNLENKTFDNISHEHLGYYSFTAFERLLEKHGLEIMDVEINGVNGGSMRNYIRKVGSPVQPFPGALERLAAIRAREKALQLDTTAPYDAFYAHACEVRDKLRHFAIDAKAEGKSIYIYGASTRGQVILQFCGLDKSLIDGAAERNPDKYGKVTIGTGIPIFNEDDVRAVKPDYMMVLPYSFIEEFIIRESDYLWNGGKFIVPLPIPTIISGRDGVVDGVVRELI